MPDVLKIPINSILFTEPERLTQIPSWHEHIPFGMFLVELLKPALIVELGTLYGDSYCAFCQAVKELNLDTKCFAVDTWQGDEHAGHDWNEALPDLRSHHDHRYGSFSTLIQSTFDQALSRFADGTIDLLHIDGCHTYEAVKHDFETWLPKVSQRGVILFHDTTVLERGFGVHRFWAEVSNRYPHFEFQHGHGLGVLAVGQEVPDALLPMLNASPEETVWIRRFFHSLGNYVATAPRMLREAQANKDEMNVLLAGRDQRIKELEAEKLKLQHEIDAARETITAFSESRAGKLTQLLWKIRSAIFLRA